MTDWPELEARVFLRVAKRSPVVIVRGEGSRVWDDQGKSYLDLVAGWAVNVLGHCHPIVLGALAEQAQSLIQVSNQFYSTPQLELAKFLVAHSCCDRAFFANSGAEVNEGAIKLARKWGKLKRDGAYEVITALGSFHGRTLAMVAATGKPVYQEPFQPIPHGFLNVPFNDLDAIKQATTERTVAVMLEPVQGEGGVKVPDPGFLRSVRAWCDQNSLLLIADEVQTGVGRLGSFWAHTQFGFEPDIMTAAKGLGGGLPIGALLAKEKASVFEPGDHGSTFGGNPLVCAVSLAVARYVLENNLPERAQRLGALFKESLAGLRSHWPFIQEVRGLGLLLALQFDADLAHEVMLASVEEGLLVNEVTPSAIRFMPSLLVTEAELQEGLTRLERALGRVAESRAEIKGPD